MCQNRNEHHIVSQNGKTDMRAHDVHACINFDQITKQYFTLKYKVLINRYINLIVNLINKNMCNYLVAGLLIPDKIAKMNRKASLSHIGKNIPFWECVAKWDWWVIVTLLIQ